MNRGSDNHATGPDDAGRVPAEHASAVTGEGPQLPPSDPLTALVPCPPFRPDAVRLGPFDAEPFELQPLTWRTPDGNHRPGPDLQRCLGEWLTGALDAAGVTLGAFDRLQVHLIATDGWGPVQAVAGWITRAHNTSIPPPDSGRPTAHGDSGTDPP